MRVAAPSVTILSETTAVPAFIAVKPSSRGSLLNALVETGCEAIALALQATSALASSRTADAQADQHLNAVRRLAVRGAGESAGVHGCPCWRRFEAIDQHGQQAQHHDASEDGWIGKALALFARVTDVLRLMNRRLEAEITKRGYRRE